MSRELAERLSETDTTVDDSVTQEAEEVRRALAQEVIEAFEPFVVTERSLTTRKKVQRLVDEMYKNDCGGLDLTRVEFISRSVADELRYYCETDGIRLTGLNDSVRELFEYVAGTEIINEYVATTWKSNMEKISETCDYHITVETEDGSSEF